MANKWLVHIKKTMKTMKAKGTYVKGKGLKQVILAAKKTWHKVKTGGGGGDGNGFVDVSLKDDAPPAATTGTEVADPDSPPNIAGRRRRKTRRRRHSRRR